MCLLGRHSFVVEVDVVTDCLSHHECCSVLLRVPTVWLLHRKIRMLTLNKTQLKVMNSNTYYPGVYQLQP